jgi:phosphoribosylformylglycinamidine cyclo-ligase
MMGDIAEDEMFRVFNMGIGYVVIVAPEDERAVRRELGEGWVIGTVTAAPDHQTRAVVRGLR